MESRKPKKKIEFAEMLLKGMRALEAQRAKNGGPILHQPPSPTPKHERFRTLSPDEDDGIVPPQGTQQLQETQKAKWKQGEGEDAE